MITFFGRWASAVVLSYIEEALAEVTHTWSLASASSNSASSPAPAAQQQAFFLENSSSLAVGQLETLTARVAAADAGMLQLRDRLSTVEVQVLDEISDRIAVAPQESTSPFYIRTPAKTHLLFEGTTTNPKPLWSTVCGWRCGTAHNAQLLTFIELSKLEHSLCERCLAWQARHQP